MSKTVTITVKKKTLESVYNQVRLCCDMGFPNFQKGEPINDLMKEAKRDISTSYLTRLFVLHLELRESIGN